MACNLISPAQAYPVAATYTQLYVVPALTTSVVSSIIICNQSGVKDTIRISIRVGGAIDSTKDKIYYDLPVDKNDTFIATIGITLSTTDEVWVYTTNGTCSFNLFGQENT